MTSADEGLPDETLAASAQRGDRKAFDALVARHKEPLYRLLRRYLGNADDAYDLLQDTLISVWESLPRYDPTRSFFAWTRTIALNKCRDWSRRQRFRRCFSPRFAAEQPHLSPSPAELVELNEVHVRQELRLRRLDSAIAALPASYKEPLLLTSVDGLSQQAAAMILKTTPKAVEMRLRRARLQLARLLEPARGE